MPFFTTSYDFVDQAPSKICFAFCNAANVATGCLLPAPIGWKCAGEASSKSGMFMGAALFSALKAMSNGCQGPVSSSPGFFSG